MLRHSVSLLSTSRSDDHTSEKDEEKGDFGPIPEVEIYGVILESHSDPRDPVTKKRRKIIPQKLISTAASHTKWMVSIFTRKINDRRIAMVKLKG